MENTIYPGKVLLDTDGLRVQAHGGALFYEGGTYYFYGENKEKTTGKNRIWTWGVRCYSSHDLYNWKNEGYIIPPELNDKNSLLHPYHYLDRPHIIRCRATGKYVCWLKFSAKSEFCFAVLVADRFLGPYRMVRDRYRPYGLHAGDFDILQCSDGKTYLYFTDNVKKNVVACELTDDCTEVQGQYRTYYDGIPVPYCREGIAVFEHEKHIYMLTSGMSGYVPNATQAAELRSPLEELVELGDPHIGDKSGASFYSQISAVFIHPQHRGVLIALADRWIPSLQWKDGEGKRMMNAIAACSSRKYHAKLREIVSLAKLPLNCKKVNTSVADYVWLPVQIKEGKPVIEWRDAWSIEELIAGEQG